MIFLFSFQFNKKFSYKSSFFQVIVRNSACLCFLNVSSFLPNFALFAISHILRYFSLL